MQNQNNQVKQQLTEEELQRTQVLNFDDFKETARIEKIGSKKPATIVAMIGLIAIIFGASYPTIQSLVSKPTASVNVQKREEDKVTKSNLNCTKSTNNADGTTEKITIDYNFEDDKLTSFEKKYTMIFSQGGENAIKAFKESLSQYLIQKSGYDVSVKEVENGIEITTIVDYNLLDVNEIPQINQNNYRFNVAYVKNSTKSSILKDMQKQQFTCL